MALYLSAELTKTHSFSMFFGDFAHWVPCSENICFLFLVNT